MNTEFDYITDNYLNRARLALLGLNRVSEGELLSMEPFSTPLYELGVSIKPYDVTLAFELAESFISEVEEVFVRMGKLPLIIDPRE